MITVENLIKDYGHARALHGVSFEVPGGQVLGFLGPNGAGKTTTMKILTGCLYATGGRALVDGFDVATEPMEVRRRVGYLPESNPLYMDMRVDDYLEFSAQVRGVEGPGRRKAIQRVIRTCGLEPVYKMGIIELSKGFRQRVGLAQAMIHDPEILILDEPTSGLDPNQIIEIRDLIRSIGANRTVILSTHILQEVEATCDRIIIVHEGRIVADGSGPELCSRLPGGPLEVEVMGPAEQIRTQLEELFVGGNIELLPESGEPDRGARFRIVVGKKLERNAREAVFDLVKGNGWKLLELHREQANLERVFRRYTLPDGGAEEEEQPLEVGAASPGGENDA